MPLMGNVQTEQADLPMEAGALTPAMLVEHPLFPVIDRDIAGHLITIHRDTPRLARLKASHRKWLMTQSMYALSIQRRDDDPNSGLNPARFIGIATTIGAASRNTADAFLKELLAYKFLREVEHGTDKRMRFLETTDASDRAMVSWFMGHMQGLDRLDGGGRETACIADPRIFRLAQPRAAERLIANPVWRYPADSIRAFLFAEFGGMILHELMNQIEAFRTVEGRVIVGPVSVPALAVQYGISVTNIKTMFRKTEEAGFLGWIGVRGNRTLWLSEGFLADYLMWQAQKFSALDEAFRFAHAQVSGQPPETPAEGLRFSA